MSFTFDTLEYAKTLREGEGAVDPKQAEKMALALKNALSGTGGVATKGDIENLRVALKADTDNVRSTLKADIDNVRSTLKAEIDNVRSTLKAEIDNVRSTLKAEIDNVRSTLKAQIDSVRQELTFHRWAFGLILALQVAILARVLMQ